MAKDEPPLPRKDQSEFGWKALDAQLAWSRHFDFKPGPLLAIAGGISVVVADRLKKPPVDAVTWVNFVWLLVVAFCLLVVFFQIISAVSPTASASRRGLFPPQHAAPDDRPESLIYFGDIARKGWNTKTNRSDREAWKRGVENLTEAEILRDLADQVTENAIIVNDKARRFRMAASWLMLAIVLIGLNYAVIETLSHVKLK